MKKMFFILLLGLTFSLHSAEDLKCKIIKKNGRVVSGNYLGFDNDVITIELADGKSVDIKKSDIKKVFRADGEKVEIDSLFISKVDNSKDVSDSPKNRQGFITLNIDGKALKMDNSEYNQPKLTLIIGGVSVPIENTKFVDLDIETYQGKMMVPLGQNDVRLQSSCKLYVLDGSGKFLNIIELGKIDVSEGGNLNIKQKSFFNTMPIAQFENTVTKATETCSGTISIDSGVFQTSNYNVENSVSIKFGEELKNFHFKWRRDDTPPNNYFNEEYNEKIDLPCGFSKIRYKSQVASMNDINFGGGEIKNGFKLRLYFQWPVAHFSKITY